MRTLLTGIGILLFVIQMSGCVTGDDAQRIRPEDTTWIQKGQTTQKEIIAKFGQPQFTGTQKGVGQLAEYTYSPPAPVGLEPRPSGPFPQAYTPPAQTRPETEALKERFWVLYDSQGIVQDFGFGAAPK